MSDLYTKPSVSNGKSSDKNEIDALWHPKFAYWDTSNNGGVITYSFISKENADSYEGEDIKSVFQVHENIKNNIASILSSLESVIDVKFVEVPDTNLRAIRYMSFESESGKNFSFGHYPSTEPKGGDVQLNLKTDFSKSPGTYPYSVLIHETLHALGLKHPGNYDVASGKTPGPYLSPNEDNNTNTVMTYNDHRWSPVNYHGSYAITPMAYDIRALQHLYGEKSNNETNTAYKFKTVYGYTVNDDSKIFGSLTTQLKQCIWDSGGDDTLDFSGLESSYSGYYFDINEGGILTQKTAYNSSTNDTTHGPTHGPTHGASYIDQTTKSEDSNPYYTSSYGTTLAYNMTIENLIGTSSNDTIIGNKTNNTLNAGAGNDSLAGGAGNDYMAGGYGNDTLIGGAGNDSLTGGTGADRFTFYSPTEGIDTITDFRLQEGDKLVVSASGFGGGLQVGAVPWNQFITGSTATTADHRFIYNPSTGAMFFDADGNGSAAQVQIATLSPNLPLRSQPMSEVFIRSSQYQFAGFLTYNGTNFQSNWIQKDWVGSWGLGSNDKHFVGDFNGDGKDDVFIRSPQYAGLLTYNGTNFQSNWIQKDWVGSWGLGSNDQHFVGDFNGDGKDDVFIRSAEYAGLLTYDGTGFQSASVQQGWVGGWAMASGDQHFVGDFNGDGKSDVFIRSPQYAGLLTYNGTNFQSNWIQKDWVGSWGLGSNDQQFVGDFNGDGKDDVFIRSAEYAGLLTYDGTGFQSASVQQGWINGNAGSWQLQAGDQHFVGDFNKDGKDDILIRSAEYAGLLTYSGSGFQLDSIQHDLMGSWNMASGDQHFVGNFSSAVASPIEVIS